MKRILILILIVLSVVLISGCTSQTNKHYDNKIVAFDYPANLEVKEDNSSYLSTLNFRRWPTSLYSNLRKKWDDKIYGTIC